MTAETAQPLPAHNVLVDFHCSRKDEDTLAERFEKEIHLQSIGNNQYQVGLGVIAPNEGEAYRRAVSYVKANLSLINVTEPSILNVAVYGPEGRVVFD